MSISKNISQKSQPIALFDSGVGGLTVLNQLKKILPNETYLYFGDTLHMPYGEKTKTQLLEYSDKIFKYFEKRNCKAVVMACNTTSSQVFEDLKDRYNFKIYSIVHSVSEVLGSLDIARLGIFATRGTILSGAYQEKITQINPNMKVFGQFCPDWVHIVEENSMNQLSNIKIIKCDLEKMLENNPQKIVLGCTHYPYLLDVLSEFAPREMFIDPAIDFAKYIKFDLDKQNLLAESKEYGDEFFVSSNPESFKVSAKMFCELEDKPELLTL